MSVLSTNTSFPLTAPSQYYFSSSDDLNNVNLNPPNLPIKSSVSNEQKSNISGFGIKQIGKFLFGHILDKFMAGVLVSEILHGSLCFKGQAGRLFLFALGWLGVGNLLSSFEEFITDKIQKWLSQKEIKNDFIVMLLTRLCIDPILFSIAVGKKMFLFYKASKPNADPNSLTNKATTAYTSIEVATMAPLYGVADNPKTKELEEKLKHTSPLEGFHLLSKWYREVVGGPFGKIQGYISGRKFGCENMYKALIEEKRNPRFGELVRDGAWKLPALGILIFATLMTEMFSKSNEKEKEKTESNKN